MSIKSTATALDFGIRRPHMSSSQGFREKTKPPSRIELTVVELSLVCEQDILLESHEC